MLAVQENKQQFPVRSCKQVESLYSLFRRMAQAKGKFRLDLAKITRFPMINKAI